MMGTKMGTRRVRSIRHVARPSRISEREKGFEPSTSTLARGKRKRKGRKSQGVQFSFSCRFLTGLAPPFRRGGYEKGYERRAAREAA